MNDRDKLREIALRDGRYSPEAYYFLFEALEVAVKLAGKDELQGTARHVTGQEVLGGMRQHAINSFGPLAGHVWRSWGIKSTLDWGRIVFVLVEQSLLRRQDDDRLEDFAAGFDFDAAFVDAYKPQLSGVLGMRPSHEEETS
jgi:uncharacterized repeat protein (TIGR04138 family)